MSLISDQKQLEKICDLIDKHEIAFIDTEFIRETTYLPVLCLIQINVAGICYAVDPLSGIDLRPFFAILHNQKITKIFHSGRQDLEILSYVFMAKNNDEFSPNFSPQAIFDTQIMAAFCGMGHTVSYSNLAKNLLDQDVAKDWQRSDWQKRPLHPDQIEYAKIDVLHLPPIYEILLNQLTKENKLSWIETEMDLNVKKAIAKDDLYKNFSFANKSSSYVRNIYLLAKWRDDVARQHNVPRAFVLKDEVIEKIAFRFPNNEDELEKCGFRTRIIRQNIKAEIVDLLNNQNLEIDLDPEIIKQNTGFRLNEAQKETYQKSKILLQEQAGIYRVSPELIINQTNLQHLISGYKSIAEVLPDWRYIVFGEKLEKLISTII